LHALPQKCSFLFCLSTYLFHLQYWSTHLSQRPLKNSVHQQISPSSYLPLLSLFSKNPHFSSLHRILQPKPKLCTPSEALLAFTPNLLSRHAFPTALIHNCSSTLHHNPAPSHSRVINFHDPPEVAAMHSRRVMRSQNKLMVGKN
jgi:hypothetical protein